MHDCHSLGADKSHGSAKLLIQVYNSLSFKERISYRGKMAKRRTKIKEGQSVEKFLPDTLNIFIEDINMLLRSSSYILRLIDWFVHSSL